MHSTAYTDSDLQMWLALSNELIRTRRDEPPRLSFDLGTN